MELLDQYISLRQQVFAYFGFEEDWTVLPLDDAREYFWKIDGQQVKFADTERELSTEEGNYYENEAYLAEWIFRADGYTLLAVDTKTDGNKFLQVFANANERP